MPDQLVRATYPQPFYHRQAKPIERVAIYAHFPPLQRTVAAFTAIKRKVTDVLLAAPIKLQMQTSKGKPSRNSLYIPGLSSAAGIRHYPMLHVQGLGV